MKLSGSAKFFISCLLGLAIIFLGVSGFVPCMFGLCYVLAFLVCWMFML